MAKSRWLLLYLCFVFLIPPCHAQSDPAAAICMGILKENLYDSNNVYSAQYHFSQYQSILKNANFSSYAEYSSKGAGLGLDIPLADGLIGFSGDYKTDDSTFQQQMNSFLSSQYDNSIDQSVFSQQTMTINTQLVRVADNCQQNYFNALKDRIKLSIRVEPNDYGSFTVQIHGYIPQPFDRSQNLQITQIEPTPDVTCTSGGQPIRLPVTSDSSDIVLLRCTKSVDKNIQFAIATNLGLSDPIALPPMPPPTPPRQATAASVKAVWSSSHPTANLFPYLGCGCVSLRNDPVHKTVNIVNNCSQAVPTIYVKDTDKDGPFTPMVYERDGRSFAYFVLGAGQDAVLDMQNAVGGVATFLACPDAPTPVAPLVCRMDAPGGVVLLPAFAPQPSPPPPYLTTSATNFGYCLASAAAKKGDACSCPKLPPQTGTVPGHVNQ